MALLVFLSASAHGTVPDTARIPIIVNVNAVVTITPPTEAVGVIEISKSVSANTPDTLTVALGPSGQTSASPWTQMRSNAPAVISHSRGSVSLKLQPQQYSNAMVSLYSINGKRIMSGKADVSKTAINLSRANIAPGVYMLQVKDVKGSSYATRLTHCGGKLNINIAFTSENAASPSTLTRVSSVIGDWTITVQAEGYNDTSYAFSPVKGMNPEQSITLRVPTFAIDISKETEWNYMVVGGDGSTMFIEVDESTDMPIRVFLRPDKNSDEGFTIFFKENGLPDKTVVDGHILYFDNFMGNKYDLAIIYPDNTIEYFYDIETDVNWDDYNSAPRLAKAYFIGGIFNNPIFRHSVGVGSCVLGLFYGCASYVIKSTIDVVFDDFTADVSKTLVDVIFCAAGSIINCVSGLVNSVSLLSYLDFNLTTEKARELYEASEHFVWRSNIKFGEPLTDPRNNRKYTTVVIGSQTWMAENLNYSGSDGNVGVCHDGSESNCNTYGRLYTWAEAMDISSTYNSSTYGSGSNVQHQGICPVGWRLPNDNDWTALTAAVGNNAGTKLKSQTGWNTVSGYIPGTDEFGFSALPGGSGYGGNFYNVGIVGVWWSASEHDASDAQTRHINYDSVVFTSRPNKNFQNSARCLLDERP